MAIKKRKMWLEFEVQSLLDLRKILFREKLTMNDFFRYLIDMLITNDERMVQFLHEAREYKTDKALIDPENEKMDADMLYDLIKRERSDQGLK